MNKFFHNLRLSIIFGIAHSITTFLASVILTNQYSSLTAEYTDRLFENFQPVYIIPMILFAICLPITVIAISKENYLFTISKSKGILTKLLDSIGLSLLYSSLCSCWLVYFLNFKFSIYQTPMSFATTMFAITIGFWGMIFCQNLYTTYKK